MTEFEPFILPCRSANIGDSAVWVNGSVVLNPLTVHNQTSGRVRIALNNSLSVNISTRHDSAIYSCWFDTTQHAIYDVSVTPIDDAEEDVMTYLGMLAISYLFDFVVFLLILSIQGRLRYKHVLRKDKGSESGSDESKSLLKANKKKGMKQVRPQKIARQ